MDEEVAALVSRLLREKGSSSRGTRLLTTAPECAKPDVSAYFDSLLLHLY